MKTRQVKKFTNGFYEVNKFYRLASKVDCAYTVFFFVKHISTHITVSDDPIVISGVCEAYRIMDSDTLHIGYLFITLKSHTKVTPLMLSVKVPPDQDDYVEIPLPPKFGVLSYKSSNGSTLVIAQDELNLHYIIKDVQT